MSNAQSNNPLDMLQGMWNQMGFQLPGMVTPTLDEGELDKQIRDLRSVENWLRMNLSMLQMTIQSLEMQRSTLTAVRAMGQMAAERSAAGSGEAPPADGASPFAQAAMWPWNMMQQMQAQMQQNAEAAPAPSGEPEATKAAVKKSKKQ